MRGKSIEEIRELVKDFKRSQTSVVEYCRERGLNPYRIRWYIRRLRNHVKQKSSRITKKKPGFTLIEMNQSVASNAPITLKYKDLTIELQDNFGLESLQKVLKVIGRFHV